MRQNPKDSKRNGAANLAMSKPKVFVGSSVEGLSVAFAIQKNLTHDAEVTVWPQGVFGLSKSSIESLTKSLNEHDFGVFVFTPDDIVSMRGSTAQAVRDNVIFEFGLFVGRLGRERVYFVIPSNEEIHFPTDLTGVQPGHYEANRSDKNLDAATGPFCNEVRTQIKSLGIFSGRASETLLEVVGGSTVTESKHSWIKYFFDKKYDDAKNQLAEEFKTETGDTAMATEAWMLLCDVRKRGDGDLSCLVEFAEKHRDSVPVQLIVAAILRLERNTKTAREILLAAQARDPKNASLAQAISLCSAQVSDISEAVAELQRFGPANSPDVAISLAEILENEERLDDALSVIQSCHSAHPSHEQIRFKYARLAQELNQHEIALALLADLCSYDNTSSEYYGYLGNSCLALDLCDKALACYRRAEELVSETGGSWIEANIGNILNYKGFPSEASKYFKRALKKDPDSQYAYDRMGKALLAKEAEAKQYLKFVAVGKSRIREIELAPLQVLETPAVEIPSTTGLLGRPLAS